MSKFKSYINSKARDENQNLSNDSTTLPPLRHITQIAIEANDDDD
ncbi:unnamed protein product, partial [Rotaria socialis]